MAEITGRVALVTGGAGIGREAFDGVGARWIRGGPMIGRQPLEVIATTAIN